MLRWMVIGFVCCSSAALAECPGHVSTLPGIKLSRAEPFVGLIYRQTPEGLTKVRVGGDGVDGKMLTVYAHPLAPGQFITAKGAIVLDYATDLDQLDRLDQTGLWTSAVKLMIEGEVVTTEHAEKRLLGIETVTIGDCRVDVWVVEDRQSQGEGHGMYTVQSYAPALGVVVRSVLMSADGQPLPDVKFDRIEVLTD